MIATIAFFGMLLSICIQIILLLRQPVGDKTFIYEVPSFLSLFAFVLLAFETAFRSIEINFFAITNTYESLVFFSAFILLVTFLYRLWARHTYFPLLFLGASIVSLALLAVASSPIVPSNIRPPIPALQSNWLVLHVTFAFIGEAFFALAFVSAIYYLISKDSDKKANLDRITYTAIAIGYPIFSAGALVFGAIWAFYAWGRFWSWDPKETWALVTWFTYTLFLHSRFWKKLRGVFAAWMSIIGFAFTLFTFFGVNFLLSGLHSYQ